MQSRRDFLQMLAATTAAIMLPMQAHAQGEARTGGDPLLLGSERDKFGKLLPQRRLGRTGAAVTMLGFGGFNLGGIAKTLGDKAAQETIEAAIEGGVRFFDTAESYWDGAAEEAYGKLLTPKYRDVIFLQSKSYVPSPTDAKKSREHLEGSLKRLKTDHLDLWLVHSIQSPEDADKRFSSGVVDFYIQAKAKGLVRHIGFSGHYSPEANNHFLDLLAKHGEPLETCQMPINVLDSHYESFIVNTLPKLVDRGFGVCAMKTLAGGGFFRKPEFLEKHPDWKAIVPDRVSLADAMHFVWSLPVSTVVSGPDSPQQYREMIALARDFAGMTPDRRRELIDKVADLAADRNPGPQIEWFRKSPGRHKPDALNDHPPAEPPHMPREA